MLSVEGAEGTEGAKGVEGVEGAGASRASGTRRPRSPACWVKGVVNFRTTTWRSQFQNNYLAEM